MGVPLPLQVSFSHLLRVEVEPAAGGGLLQFVGAVGIDYKQETSRWPLPQYHGYRILQLS